MRGPIVVGTDGSETSRLAVEEAGAIARASGHQLVVLFVRHVSFAGVGVLATGGLSAGAVQDALDGDQALAEAQCIAILDPTGVPWRFEVGEGDPASELMRVATGLEADTIVVAGRRHGALGGLAHGSVSVRLLHRWSGALLVIHPKPTASSTSKAGTVASS
ncbi:MAG: universal stress protein [Acidimicrobiales bacterium]|jgi:nucleotide-binding universal stress UspA family protein